VSAALLRRIMQDHGDDPGLRASLSDYAHAAVLDIAACGTVACGTHLEVCDHCGDQREVPNTCGNRSCPLCQGAARARWVAARDADLLPVAYAHVVCTVPHELLWLFVAFPQIAYAILMRAATSAVLWLAAQERHVGAEVGLIAVLHTWKRDLGLHPHVHLLVTAGGWCAVTGRWVDAPLGSRRGQRGFFLPVAALRATFQRRFRRLLLRALADGEFHDNPDRAACFPHLADDATFRRYLDGLLQKRWCIRIEPPSGSPEILLRYLGRYINRVAISPGRIRSYDGQSVTFDGKGQPFTLPAADFVRRFAQHVLPPGFVRIRFCGLWATRHRGAKLEAARAWLAARGRRRTPAATTPLSPAAPLPCIGVGVLAAPPPRPSGAPPGDPCPRCGQGVYRRCPGGHRPRRAERQRLLRLMLAGRSQTPGGASIPA
jgi:hypothetical protein